MAITPDLTIPPLAAEAESFLEAHGFVRLTDILWHGDVVSADPQQVSDTFEHRCVVGIWT